MRGRLLEKEIAVRTSMAPAADSDSIWDVLYSQIRSISTRRKISEEQVINELFDPKSGHSFIVLVQSD
ncbi:MAG TPA: hypothetical protein VI794_02900 [Patescibacteria group bacterium]|nr:hypothetical protein [Patescibacteria group bacterium]